MGLRLPFTEGVEEETYGLKSLSPVCGNNLREELFPYPFRPSSSVGVFMYEGGPSPYMGRAREGVAGLDIASWGY